MPDEITSFEVYRSATSENGPWGSPIATLPGTARSYADSTNPSPRLWYKLVGRTAEGLGGDDGIPYNVVAIGSAAWNKVIGGAASEYGVATAVDAAGNILVAGVFAGSVDFGGGPLTSVGGYDLFIAKYASNGGHIWSKRFGGVTSETMKCMAVDNAGNIYLGGSFYGTCNFGGSDLVSAGDADPFLAKYDSSGNHLWSISFLKGNITDSVNGIAADTQGNVYVTGSFQGSGLVINNGKSLSSGYGSIDAFFLKFNGNGQCEWAKNFFNYGATEVGTSLALDASGNVVVGGYSISGINLGGSYLPAGGYLGKFDPNGNHIWSRSVGHDGPARVHALALDLSGNVIVAGYFPQYSDFGGGTVYGSAVGTDLYVAKYGSDGSYQWARALLGNQYGVASGVAVDANGNISVTGYFRGTVNFGNVSYTSSPTADNGFVARYSASGSPVWAKALVGSDYTTLNGVAADSQGNVIVTGGFSGSMTFNGQSLTSAGGSDILLAKILPTG